MTSKPTTKIFDVIIIGGGQAGLAVGYYLRRANLKQANLDFIILDNQPRSGGAWQHFWPSLRLFSPATVSSLPGKMMTAVKDQDSPYLDDVLTYLDTYEKHYKLPIYRPYDVQSVERDDENDCLRVSDGKITWLARTVVSATSIWSNPYIPEIEGRQTFQGEQIHSAHYAGIENYKDKRVLVVGAGNSGAQIFAELVQVADASWVTREEPQFLPDDVDGRVLFERATKRVQNASSGDTQGEDNAQQAPKGNIVMMPLVKAARDKGLLTTQPMFQRLTRACLQLDYVAKNLIDFCQTRIITQLI
ncbi:NAD(P)-binding domain-containing protein [Psychrobacter lutiphocae]|uniref:NAD(P)-binding domain-containing protein n=1 Tax=Psychrobacter lutiphocae TaxID=540500 RepID=UPI000375CFF0|nr:NAD(P)-binding domain-containing protein [Psychrobacter lutiphocae]